jgi:hypothetical protein
MGQSAISPAWRSFSVLEIFGEAFSNLGKRLAVSNTVAHAGQSLDILGSVSHIAKVVVHKCDESLFKRRAGFNLNFFAILSLSVKLNYDRLDI